MRHSSKKRFQQLEAQLRKEERSAQPAGHGHHSSPHAHASAKPHTRHRSAWKLIAQFWALLSQSRAYVVYALCTVTISTLLGLVPPASTKFVVDHVLGAIPLPQAIQQYEFVPTDRWTLLIAIIGITFCLTMFAKLVGLSGRWQATRSVKRLQMSLRKSVFEHAVRLPMSRVHELRSGGIASILREDAGSVGDLIFGLMYNPWRAFTQLTGSLVILAIVDWRLLLGAVALLPAVYFSHRTWISRIRPRFRAIRKRRTEIDSRATEAFGGMRVVRAFGRQKTETARIMTENHLMARQELDAWWWNRTIEIIWQTMIPLVTGILMLYGGYRVIHGHLTVGDLMMFVVYLLMLLEPLAVIAESSASLQNGLSALDRILDLLEEPQEFQSQTQSQPLIREDIRGRLSFEEVCFQYQSEGAFALQDISFVAEPGQMIALVGHSGAGKTTLCNLVARFFDPTSGTISCDGQDLKTFDVEQYRSLLGIVEQDVFLFDGTVNENISYSVRSATLQQIEQAAEVANATEFIHQLPQGFETVIGERGVKLSGGQRQRLAIARAVLADPRILILDEATSSLDTQSEKLIQASLANLMADRTSFVIAHRLSTIRDADLILVLENGRVIESGNHQSLLEANGKYREMLDLQLQTQANSLAMS